MLCTLFLTSFQFAEVVLVLILAKFFLCCIMVLTGSFTFQEERLRLLRQRLDVPYDCSSVKHQVHILHAELYSVLSLSK